MPFLDANALECDPKGITLLRTVIRDAPAIRVTPSWKAVLTPALLPALTRRPRFVVAGVRIAFRIFLFAGLVIAIASSPRERVLREQ